MEKTPLYDSHVALGGKIIDFGGWALPVQYTSILKEHESVRTRAGIFDVSHMGEILIEGKGAGNYIQRMVTNDIVGMTPGRIVYSPMCYEDGGTVDDLLIYMLGEEKYLLVVNASNTKKDYEWLIENCDIDDLSIKDLSEEYALLAIQGPLAKEILGELTDTPLDNIRFFRFLENIEIGGVKALVSRTGYTGEDGFELYIPSDKAVELWDKILNTGKNKGLVPAGLGARDTLRFEVTLPLYGQELSPEISPLEAGLGHFVKLDKESFIGKDALIAQNEKTSKRRFIGFEMVDRGIPRTGYKVLSKAGEIGFVTSGSFSPTLKKNLGLALVTGDSISLGDELFVQMRGKELRAKIVDTPFYVKQYNK